MRYNWPLLHPGLDIQIRYTLQAENGSTRVVRDINLNVVGVLKVAQPVLVRSITAENHRILAKMKAYLEAQSA
jgi:hypothetical protein